MCVVELPTKVSVPPGMVVSGGGEGLGAAEVLHPAGYSFEPDTSVVVYTEQVLPPAAMVEFEMNTGPTWNTKMTAFTGRDVVNATIKAMAWFARTGVPVHTAGRPFHAEAAKGALVIVADAEFVWRCVCGGVVVLAMVTVVIVVICFRPHPQSHPSSCSPSLTPSATTSSTPDLRVSPRTKRLYSESSSTPVLQVL